jgi:hypothetical protein
MYALCAPARRSYGVLAPDSVLWPRALHSLRLAVALLCSSVLAASTPILSASADGGALATVDAYETARTRGDVDRVLALFANDAVIVDAAGGTHQGSGQIRRFLQHSPHPDWSAIVMNPRVSGERVLWQERVGVRGTARTLSVEAVVRAGTIVALAYGGRELPASNVPSKDPAPTLSPMLGLTAVFLTMAFTLGVVGRSVPRRGNSACAGRLLADLRHWTRDRSQRHSSEALTPWL